jgi:hypothetical protein
LVTSYFPKQKEENMKTKMKFASLAMMSIMAVLGTTNQVWADKGQQQLELRARQNKIINHFEAELRGDYRERPGRDRLNAELEKINIPVGTPVAFCLVQNGNSTMIGVANVRKSGGTLQAEIELEAENGDFVPSVEVGDLLEAHQRTSAPFNSNPTCGETLLLSASFQK